MGRLEEKSSPAEGTGLIWSRRGALLWPPKPSQGSPSDRSRYKAQLGLSLPGCMVPIMDVHLGDRKCAPVGSKTQLSVTTIIPLVHSSICANSGGTKQSHTPH